MDIPTYQIKVEIDRHVPSDTCFYIVFEYRRTVNGIEDLKRLLARGFNEALLYIENDLEDKNGKAKMLLRS